MCSLGIRRLLVLLIRKMATTSNISRNTFDGNVGGPDDIIVTRIHFATKRLPVIPCIEIVYSVQFRIKSKLTKKRILFRPSTQTQ